MKTRLICLLLLVAFVFSNCEDNKSPKTGEELAKIREQLEAKKKELSDKQAIAEIEAELKEVDAEIKRVDSKKPKEDISTGTIDSKQTQRQVADAQKVADAGAGAQIVGSGVVMRKESSVKSDKLGNFNDNERVTVLETKNVNNDNEAILTKPIALYASEAASGQEVMRLPKGKAVLLESYDAEQNKHYVSYQDAKKGKLYAHIDADAVETISYSTWYRVKRSTGQEGWVLGKFLKSN